MPSRSINTENLSKLVAEEYKLDVYISTFRGCSVMVRTDADGDGEICITNASKRLGLLIVLVRENVIEVCYDSFGTLKTVEFRPDLDNLHDCIYPPAFIKDLIDFCVKQQPFK